MMEMHVYVQTIDKIKYSHYRINSVFFSYLQLLVVPVLSLIYMHLKSVAHLLGNQYYQFWLVSYLEKNIS